MGSWRVFNPSSPLSKDPLHFFKGAGRKTVNTTEGSGASAPKVVQKHVPGHASEMLVCESCGAKAFLSERKRFNKRHPSLCSARKAFSKQLAQGTRCVDAEDLADQDRAARRERWDAWERSLGGEPR